MKTTETGALASKADLLVLALERIEKIVDDSTAGPPLALHEVAAVKALAEEIRCATAELDEYGESIERLFEKRETEWARHAGRAA